MLINVNNTIKVMNSLYKKKIPVLPKIIYLFNRVVYACDIRPNVNINSNVVFPHNALSVVVHHNAYIGGNTKILHHVTIGGNMNKTRLDNGQVFDAPVIGSNVLIGVGSIVIGPIVIGDNAIIGAGSVVTKDVLPNEIVYGISAKIKGSRR